MPPEDPALVERDRDLASLVAALAHAPAVVVVEGEPGIGKTSLVRRALADPTLADRLRLLGSARPPLASCPLGPVIEALATANRPPVQPLSALCGVLRTVLPDLADILPPAPPPLEDPHLIRHRLVRAVAELLAKLGPAILVIEDLQWADEATVGLLRMISAAPPPELSIAITCVSSADPPNPGPVTGRLRLSPLSASAAGRLAGALLGEPDTALPDAVADLLYERNGGVPFVLREDVLLLHRSGLLRPVNGAWSIGPSWESVPSAVADDIIARVRSLGTDAGAVLEATAVLAGSAEPELVGTVAGVDPERASVALADATRCGLLRDHDPASITVRFRHELARLAVYHAMSGHRRRRLHGVAARELAGGGRAVPAIEHYRLAGDTDGWTANAEAAAELATAEGSFAAAHGYLRDVLQAGAVAKERQAEVAIKLGWTTLGDADQSGTTAALLTEAQDGGHASPGQRAELRLLRAWSSLVDRGETHPVDELDAAIGDLARRPDLRAIALAVLATPTRLPDHDVRAQRARLDQARATLAETPDPMAHAVVLTTAAHLLLAIGDPDGWAAADALTAHADRPDVNRQVVRGLLDLADAALHLGHYSRGLELVERARRLAADAKSRAYDPLLRAAVLRIRWMMGDAGAEREVSGLAGDQNGPGRLHARLLWAQIRTGQGRLDGARRMLLAVAEEARGIGELAIASHAVAEFNRVALTMAHRRLGHAHARQTLDALARKRVAVWAAPLMPFVPLDLVRAVLPRYRNALAGLDAPLARAALCFAEARVSEQDGDAVRASDGYRRARHAYAALPDPRLAAHACVSEVRCQLAAGQAPDTDLLRHAWATFTGLDAAWDADRLKELMRAAGLSIPHRRGRPGYGHQLSPREREVADLAASGHTNRDIAAKLYLSDRTVKYHLANAMRKLEVSSRRRLRDVLEPESSADDASEPPEDHTCRCVRCGRALNPSLLDGSSD